MKAIFLGANISMDWPEAWRQMLRLRSAQATTPRREGEEIHNFRI
ncbi:hypothetical protein SAMN03080617_00937 [Algoriphagus alkaliphilus]|uniref:Uncharacterized protein n=1 Tax=Algoriphagus alkaliphilus TaxID=279824 RepID=A0A1G5W5M9_9BACT|nr:hypothetical protein SAMN03080617_00937 [Algoriphagus alkaliphilus]